MSSFKKFIGEGLKVRVRDKPSITGNIVGYLHSDQIVNIDEENSTTHFFYIKNGWPDYESVPKGYVNKHTTKIKWVDMPPDLVSGDVRDSIIEPVKDPTATEESLPLPSLIAFSPNEYRSFKVIGITDVSVDTKRFKIQLPTPEHEMGLITSSLIRIRFFNQEGVECSRPYTPITLNNHKGSFELIVKKYEGGILSSYLHNLAIGDLIEIKGPFFKLNYVPNKKRVIGFLAGGTGIAPCYQVRGQSYFDCVRFCCAFVL